MVHVLKMAQGTHIKNRKWQHFKQRLSENKTSKFPQTNPLGVQDKQRGKNLKPVTFLNLQPH